MLFIFCCHIIVHGAVASLKIASVRKSDTRSESNLQRYFLKHRLLRLHPKIRMAACSLPTCNGMKGQCYTWRTSANSLASTLRRPVLRPQMRGNSSKFGRICKGTSLREINIESLGKRKKCTRMMRCLSRALWRLDQKFMAEARCLCLLRDERKGRLLIRFHAVSADLQCRSGTFGQSKEGARGAVGCCEQTAKMVEQFCESDNTLRDHILQIMEAVTADTASEEMLAGELAWQGQRAEHSTSICVLEILSLVLVFSCCACCSFLYAKKTHQCCLIDIFRHRQVAIRPLRTCNLPAQPGVTPNVSSPC